MDMALPKRATFRRSLFSLNDSAASLYLKCTYLFMQLLDLGLTLVATSMGFKELNPFIDGMLDSYPQLLLVKLLIPLLIMRFVPGKLLIPAILLLSFVVAWNIRELLTLAL